jgi:hypothetical protein
MAQSNFRVLKHTQPLHIQPSLRINAFTRPSARVLNEFILGIEVENLLDTPVVLNQLSALSAKWILKSDRDPSMSEIQGGQTVYLYYRFVREGTGGNGESPESVVGLAIEKVIIGEDDKAKIDPPALGVMISTLMLGSDLCSFTGEVVKELSISSRTAWRLNNLQHNYPGLEEKRLTSLFTLYYSDDVDLTLFWIIPSSGSIGHQHIMGINLSLQSPLHAVQSKFSGKGAELGVSRALYAETVREKKELVQTLVRGVKEDSPLRVKTKCEGRFEHDFSKGDCCVPIEICVFNSSVVETASYTIELLQGYFL